MSPAPRAAALMLACALLAAFVAPGLAALLALLLLAAVVADALVVWRRPGVARQAPPVLARGVPSDLRVTVAPAVGRTRVRQPLPPDLDARPREATGELAAKLIARRRGRHPLPPVATRRTGPLGLGRWTRQRVGTAGELLVYPDVPAARRIAIAVRQGRFREQGRLTRGPLGLGTEFESIRDYLPDDDVRQVNWRATQRMGRPMSNQFRVEQDREVLLLLDSGRLMRAPLGDRTRLDAALDAAVAVALVADMVGDRCGALAFDAVVRRSLAPRRGGGDGVVRTFFDLEPSAEEADYARAFQAVAGRKRALVLLLTDLVDEAAAKPLADAIPILARKHHVLIAAAADPAVGGRLAAVPRAPVDVYAQAVALDVLAARERTARLLRQAGAETVEAPPEALGAACVRAYLRAKARARL